MSAYYLCHSLVRLIVTVYVLFCRLLAVDDASIYLEDVKYGSVDTVIDLDFNKHGSHAAYFEVRDGGDALVLHKNSTLRWFHDDSHTSTSWRDNGVFVAQSVSEVYHPSSGNQSSNRTDSKPIEGEGQGMFCFSCCPLA